MRSQSARWPMLPHRKRAVPPDRSISRTSSSPATPCVSTSSRRAPAAAKRSALARPMPLAAPVITAALPASRPLDIGTQALPRGAEPVDAELDLVAGREVARRAVAQPDARRGARGDDVAGQERHKLTDVADQGRHVEDQLARRAALLGLAVHFEPKWEIVYVADLVGRGEKRPERREGIAALALHPLAPTLELEGALRVVVVQHVPGDVAQGVVAVDIPGAATDDDRQLHLPIDFGGALRDHHVVIRPADRAGRLEEDDRLFGNFLTGLARVITIIEADAHDLAGPAQWGAQPYTVRDDGRGAALPRQPAGQPLEAGRSEECLVVVGPEPRCVDAAAVGQDQAGPLFAGIAESDEFHRFTSSG